MLLLTYPRDGILRSSSLGGAHPQYSHDIAVISIMSFTVILHGTLFFIALRRIPHSLPFMSCSYDGFLIGLMTDIFGLGIRLGLMIS